MILELFRCPEHGVLTKAATFEGYHRGNIPAVLCLVHEGYDVCGEPCEPQGKVVHLEGEDKFLCIPPPIVLGNDETPAG